MTFISTDNLKALFQHTTVIDPYEEARIKNGSYELSLGAEVFQTDSIPKEVRKLNLNDTILIRPGQFALLLTHEYLKIPTNKIAFISIKAGIKFKGLVNVSGFHVDPGFEGHLLFSVYNAGPSNITLSSGTPYFPIWFANLDATQNYENGTHAKQRRIPDDAINALSQGELASPNVLSRRIDDVKDLKTKIEWVVLAILGLVVGLLIRVWTEKDNLNQAVEFGYAKKSNEILSDTNYQNMAVKITNLNAKVDSLSKLVK